MPISVLIVDDEPMARERIADLLRSQPEVNLLGERGDGREAVTAIRELRPDLVFLDIQMPEMSGFEVIEALNDGELPEIIFTTAYDKFALRAFEVHAVDYLLKPFERDRFLSALDAARAHRGPSRKGGRPSAFDPCDGASLAGRGRRTCRGENRWPHRSGGR